MELTDYLRALRAHWAGVLIFVIAGLAAAGAYTLTQPEVYAANANGFVSTGVVADNAALASVNDSLAKSRAKSYADIALSRATATQVIEDLGLDADPAGLIGSISVELPPDTVLLKITAHSTSPELAQQLADAWVVALATQVEAVENPSGAKGSGAPQVLPIESAALPTSPISPRPHVNLALGLVIGALFGLAYALVRNQLDRRLRTTSEVQKTFGVAVVGSVPFTRNLERKDGLASISVGGAAGARGAESAEAFRKLRTNLSYMDVDNPPRVMVVTSPHESDGKSTVAANLAAAIAVSGQRVTLVDGDLRRPTIAESFGLVEGAGLTDILIGKVSLDDVLQAHDEFTGLSILAAGSIPPNPSELLGSQAMRSLLEELAKSSMVIIDSPPLLPVTDAAVLTTHCDGALVVVTYGKTKDNELGDALANLAAVQGRVLGVIFNGVPRRNSAGGYYGNYYYRSATPPPRARARFGPRRVTLNQ